MAKLGQSHAEPVLLQTVIIDAVTNSERHGARRPIYSTFDFPSPFYNGFPWRRTLITIPCNTTKFAWILGQLCCLNLVHHIGIGGRFYWFHCGEEQDFLNVYSDHDISG